MGAVTCLGVLRRRRGLSEVVTTLIILAFSVLLALTAIVYTNGVTRARMKSTAGENVWFHKVHAWVLTVNDTDRAVVAFMLQNLGGKSVSIELIDVRGAEANWPDVYFYAVSEGEDVYRDLNYTSYDSLVGENVTIDGRVYSQATGNVHMRAGGWLLIYVRAPPIIFRDNIGQPILLAVGTTQTNYSTEVVVESAE